MAKNSFADHGGDLRKYFAAIPNIVFTLGLNPYELALYAHFKQAAGDKGGVCWKSRATIAREAGMSAGMVTKARQALEKPRSELNGVALITVKDEPSKTGGNPTCAVTITDIWPVNMAKWATSCGDVEAEAPSPHNQRRHTVTSATSPHVPKEKPLKKNPEEGPAFLSELKADPLYSRLNVTQESEMAQRWAKTNDRQFNKRFMVNWLNRSLKRLPNDSRDVWAGALTMKDLEARVRQ